MNDNKRIAVNTIVIYIRLIVSALIGLITTRLILKALGADDYGLYSVIGGIVSFMNIIGTSMITATNRFISVELGKGENGDINKTFNTVLLVHVLLALGLVLIGETIGLIYVNNYLNVAPEKLGDAAFVLHFSLLTTAISILSVPYHGLIVAREKFIFASSVEVLSLIVKLGLVLLLALSDGNKLRLFTLIMLLVTLMIFAANVLYCKIKDSNVIHIGLNKNKSDYKSVFSFAGWSLFGATAFIGKEQGASMVINYFFGTALNASFGLASQVNRYAMMFTKGLSQAAAPQIMKSYGANASDRSLFLVYTISRVSTLIMLLIVVPLMLCMDSVLILWLKNPPEYTTIFAQFMLINTLVTMLGAGFDACIQSTGNIKKNEIYTSLIFLSILPIIFVLYKLGFPPYMNVVILPFLSLGVRIIQIFILKKLTRFEFKKFCNEALFPSLLTITIAVVPTFLLKSIIGDTTTDTVILFACSVLWILICIYLFGLKQKERDMISSIFFRKKRATNQKEKHI